MEVRIPATLVVQADNVIEAAMLVAPTVQDVNSYLSGDTRLETAGSEPAGEG